MSGIVVIGERINHHGRVRSRDRWHGDPLSVSLRLGAFHEGYPAHRLLCSLADPPCQWWDDACNLLPPSECGAWDPAYAEEVAMRVAPLLRARYDGIVLCGRRVLHAFGYRVREAAGRDGSLLWLPHPSGSCRWYNGPLEHAEAAVLVRELRQYILRQATEGSDC